MWRTNMFHVAYGINLLNYLSIIAWHLKALYTHTHTHTHTHIQELYFA